MRLECHFKSIDFSQSLVEYAEERFSKVEKYEMKPVFIQVTFSAQRHKKTAEVNIQGFNVHYKAIAQSDDFYGSVDKVLQKIIGQMSKQKKKVQRHKNFQKSHQGRIEQMNDQLEVLPKVS
ncbi:MAG: ribosome-associated translation inhibitor RaiA [Bdellovibrionales bacterium]|nr:ribosome-associated translation inhibitor RaiA [Bdellovibrionales bacterium]